MQENQSAASNQEDQAVPTTPAGPAQPQKDEPAQPRGRQAAANKAAAVKTQASPAVTPRVNIRNRHDVSFRHDVFMSTDAEGMRNVGYEHLKPMLHKIRHKHVYHSHSNQGKRLARTGSALGHWHDVEHYVDNEGNIRAKCGPAMHEVQIQDEETGLVFNRIERVSFEELVTTGQFAGRRLKHMDDHTHELEYLGSEELNPREIVQRLKDEREEAAAHGINLGAGSVRDTSPTPLSPSDGVTLEVR